MSQKKKKKGKIPDEQNNKHAKGMSLFINLL